MRKRISCPRAKENGYDGSAKALTVGLDPEFEITRGSQVRNASHVIDASISGPRWAAEIGVDGAGDQVEFRPKPDGRPVKVVGNFKRILKRFRQLYKGYSLSFEGSTYSLGGHVHIGTVGVPGHPFSDDQVRQLVGVLDDFIGRRTLPLSGERRQRSSYYGLGKWRRQNWGFEYRVPPANVCRDAELLRLTLKMVKRITLTWLTKKYIRYESPEPTFRDYKRVAWLNEREYGYFMSATRVPAGEQGFDLLACWNMRPMRRPASRNRRFSLNVAFRDDWATMFQDGMRRALRGMTYRRPVGVVLYGLRADRGQVVAGISIEGYEQVDHPGGNYHDREHTIYVGLPYNYRVNGEGGEAFVQAVAEAIKEKARAMTSS